MYYPYGLWWIYGFYSNSLSFLFLSGHQLEIGSQVIGQKDVSRNVFDIWKEVMAISWSHIMFWAMVTLISFSPRLYLTLFMLVRFFIREKLSFRVDQMVNPGTHVIKLDICTPFYLVGEYWNYFILLVWYHV